MKPEMSTETATDAPALMALFGELLQYPDVQADDDFFDLGGDSVLAIALFAELEHRSGRCLPMTAIYDAPTPRRLALLLAADAPARRSSVVRLRDGAGTPLVIVHGIGGSAMELRRTAMAMDVDYPVLALQAPGFAGEPPLDRVESMVERYLTELEPIVGTAPYRLAGYSFGGLIAMEMARVAAARGSRIDRLIMIDSYPYSRIWPRALKLDGLWRQAVRRAALIFRGGPGALGDYVRELLGRADGTARRRVLFPDDAPVPPDVEAVQRAAEAALIAYRPTYYEGAVDFIQAAISSPSFPRFPKLYWSKRVGALTIHRVAATHRALVIGGAEDLAAALTKAVAG